MPNDLSSIQAMLQELGPSMPDIDAILQSEESSWAIQFADETVVLLDWADDPPRLMFSAGLGQPADSRRLEVYQHLLQHNLDRGEAGVRAALGGPEGEAMLMREACAGSLGMGDLGRHLQEFGMQARAWGAYVGGESDAPPATLQEPPGPPAAGGQPAG